MRPGQNGLPALGCGELAEGGGFSVGPLFAWALVNGIQVERMHYRCLERPLVGSASLMSLLIVPG